MASNIWCVTQREDLIFLLKNSNKRHVMLCLVRERTNNLITRMFKKFIKEKAKIFPNVTFLLYTVLDDDINKFGLFDEKLCEYPYVYHIYDVKHIICSRNYVVEEYLVAQLFTEIEKYYIHDRDNGGIPSDSTTDAIKLQLLISKWEQYQMEFIEDIRNRKLWEEGGNVGSTGDNDVRSNDGRSNDVCDDECNDVTNDECNE